MTKSTIDDDDEQAVFFNGIYIWLTNYWLELTCIH